MNKPRAKRAAPADVTLRLPGRNINLTFDEARIVFGRPSWEAAAAPVETAALPILPPIIPIPLQPLHVRQTPALLALIGNTLGRSHAGSSKNRHMYIGRSYEAPVEVYLRMRKGTEPVFNISASTDEGRTDDELFQAKAGVGPALLAIAMYDSEDGVSSLALYSLRALAPWLAVAGDCKDLKVKGTGTSAHYMEGAHARVPADGVVFFSQGDELAARCAGFVAARCPSICSPTA